jgi:parallel beta-helix repeat protein
VVAFDYVMTHDLGPCPGHGLVVRSNVTLDCRGFGLVGLGNGSEQYGVYLSGDTGAEVRGARVLRCDISCFLRGVRLRSAEGNSLLDNVLHDNGDVTRHVGYGLDLAAGARNNLLRGNVIASNGDEGVHFGSGSGDNDFLDNAVFDNYREQIYLLASHGNRLIGNASYGSGSNSLYLKDSDDNHLENNIFRDRTARVTGDANGNAFVNNSFVSATLQFRVYEASPNRTPANNSVSGGTMTSGATCLRFTSSSGNVVSDVLLSGCGTQILSEGTPAHPSSNTIVDMALIPSKVSVDVDSTLSVGWWLDAAVESSAGAPLAGARMRALDLLGNTVFDLITDPDGDVPDQVLLQYVRTGAGTFPRTPHVLTTTKDGSTDIRTVLAIRDLNVAVVLPGVVGPPPGGDPPDGGTEPPAGRGDFFDDFNRTDSSVPGMGWLTVQGDLAVAGGELRSNASMKGTHLAVQPSLSGTHQSAEAQFASADNNTSPRFGIVLGFHDPQSYYVVYRLIGGTSLVRISRVENGVERVLASANVPNPARGAFFRLRGEATPTGLSLELDGVRKLRVNESGFAPGSPGVLVGVASGRAAHRIDNFSASVP